MHFLLECRNNDNITVIAMATFYCIFFNIGADQLLHDHPDIIDMSVVEDTSEPLCHKDTGKTKKN